jgi:undecaprenyl-phosphate galactose phosphotransferase
MDVQAATPFHIEARSRRVLREAWLLAGVDLAVMYVCFTVGRVANWLFSGLTWEQTLYLWRVQYGESRILIYLAIGLLCLAAFTRFGHYSRRRPFWQELGDIFAVVAVMAVVDAALVFLTKSEFSRLWWASSWTLIAVLVPSMRFSVKHLLMAQGAWLRPTVVVGTGPNATDAASALVSEPVLGFDVVAFVRPPESDAGPSYLEVEGRRLPVLPPAPYPHLLPAHLGRPHVVIALEMAESERHAGFVERLNLHYGDVDIVSPMRGLPLAGTHVTHFFSHDVLALRLYNNLTRPWPRRFKRAFDLGVGGLLLLLLAPLFAWISWRVSQSGRPIFYRHERIGKGGQRFGCFKFRTMVPDACRVLADHLVADPEAQAEWDRDHKLKDDPRITPFGAWLRRTSLDELPQLFNVMRGEMSLVGPRPVIEDELARYGHNAVYYLETTPGITGLWQVSGRNELDYRRRVHLDSWYVKNWSLWCDVIILIKTPRAVLRGHGAY